MLALEYVSPDGISTIQNVTTDSSSAFDDSFTPTMDGLWTVQAYWQGNSLYSPAQSALCSFRVLPALYLTPGTDVNCRLGPGTNYGVADIAPAGDILPVEGRNSTNTWLNVRMESGLLCWVSIQSGTLNGDLDQAPVKQAPPVVVTVTPTNVPPFDCSSYTSMSDCFNDTRCTWVGMGCTNK